jgi:hypothetical protein
MIFFVSPKDVLSLDEGIPQIAEHVPQVAGLLKSCRRIITVRKIFFIVFKVCFI